MLKKNKDIFIVCPFFLQIKLFSLSLSNHSLPGYATDGSS